MNSCFYCNYNNSDLLIKKHNLWIVYLRTNQNYLGWSNIVLNRHADDLTEINKQEQDDLFKILANLKKAIHKSFSPKMINYAFLGNTVRHVHAQVVPRYDKPVDFEGLKFVDHNWGKNYSPYDKTFDIPLELKIKLTNKIKENYK
jgi:diadenosine tetraphosphate (Ap4A) HIT family hydrolase